MITTTTTNLTGANNMDANTTTAQSRLNLISKIKQARKQAKKDQAKEDKRIWAKIEARELRILNRKNALLDAEHQAIIKDAENQAEQDAIAQKLSDVQTLQSILEAGQQAMVQSFATRATHKQDVMYEMRTQFNDLGWFDEATQQITKTQNKYKNNPLNINKLDY